MTEAIDPTVPEGKEESIPHDASCVVLFDGVCNLCNGSVNFIIDHDPSAQFQFAALQSQVGAELIRKHGLRPGGAVPESVLLVEDGKVYELSTAALRIARRLRGPWKLLYSFIVVPKILRDGVYRWIARHRYAWFGRTESCRVPTPELRERFLS